MMPGARRACLLPSILIGLTSMAGLALGPAQAQFSQPLAGATMPPGAVHGGTGEAGSALAFDLAGVFINPGLGPSLLHSQGGMRRLHATWFVQTPLPGLDLTHEQTFRATGFLFPGIWDRYDAFVGYYHQHLRLGRGALNLIDGSFPERVRLEEDVHAVTLAARGYGLLSLGLTLKSIESRLRVRELFETRDLRDRVFTWDVGIQLSHSVRLDELPLELEPSLGLSFLNQGDSAFSDPTFREALPHQRIQGLGLSVRFLELLSLELLWDLKNDLVRDDLEPVWSQGVRLTLFSCLSWSRGHLEDEQKMRNETHHSLSLILDFQALNRLRSRLIFRDWTPRQPPRDPNRGRPVATAVPAGNSMLAQALWNLRLELAFSGTEGRFPYDGQRAAQISLSF